LTALSFSVQSITRAVVRVPSLYPEHPGVDCDDHGACAHQHRTGEPVVLEQEDDGLALPLEQ